MGVLPPAATIADYSACIGDYPQILGGSALACRTLMRATLSNDAGVGTMTSGLPATSACNALIAKCPEAANGRVTSNMPPAGY